MKCESFPSLGHKSANTNHLTRYLRYQKIINVWVVFFSLYGILYCHRQAKRNKQSLSIILFYFIKLNMNTLLFFSNWYETFAFWIVKFDVDLIFDCVLFDSVVWIINTIVCLRFMHKMGKLLAWNIVGADSAPSKNTTKRCFLLPLPAHPHIQAVSSWTRHLKRYFEMKYVGNIIAFLCRRCCCCYFEFVSIGSFGNAM